MHAQADINAIAQQFTQFYYNQFDSDRKGLAPLYVSSRKCLFRAHLALHSRSRFLNPLQRDHSMLSFEGQQFQGASAIVEKLAVSSNSLP